MTRKIIRITGIVAMFLCVIIVSVIGGLLFAQWLTGWVMPLHF